MTQRSSIKTNRAIEGHLAYSISTVIDITLLLMFQFSFVHSRGTFDRQDSVRSDYMSDRDGRYGIVQQASLESTDSRLCYLTSSEVSYPSCSSLTLST